MESKVVPDYDPDDRNHMFIWNILAHKLTDEDYEAIQMALIERQDEHKAIDKSERMLVEFDNNPNLRQPRPIPDYVKEQGHNYVDWDCGLKICLILSKYADFYSKKQLIDFRELKIARFSAPYFFSQYLLLLIQVSR